MKLIAITIPGGSDTQYQYNDGGIFGGSAHATLNKATGVSTFTGATVTNCAILGSDSAVFQPDANSETFFRVKNAADSNVLNVDTTNNIVTIGQGGQNKILTFPATGWGAALESRIDFVGQGAYPIISLVREPSGSDFLAMEDGFGNAMQRWSKTGRIGFPGFDADADITFTGTSAATASPIMIRGTPEATSRKPILIVREGLINYSSFIIVMQNKDETNKIVFTNGCSTGVSPYSLGIGTETPKTKVEIMDYQSYITLNNSTHENSNGGRESRWIAKGNKTDETEHTLGQMEFGHDGTGDDYDAKFVLSLNGTTGGVDTLVDAVEIGSDLMATFTGVIRGASSLWWHAYCVDAAGVSPGASGATWMEATADHLTGYRLDAANEYLYVTSCVHSDWDGASDLEIKVTFELMAAGANAADTVDIAAQCYYKGHDTAVACKTQTPEAATVVGTAAQYELFVATIIVDHDLVDNIVETGDKFSIRLNLETDTSEVDDILVSHVNFRYKTAKVGPEV